MNSCDLSFRGVCRETGSMRERDRQGEGCTNLPETNASDKPANHFLLPDMPILVVDDDMGTFESTTHTLISAGITNIFGCQDYRMVPELLKTREFTLALIDPRMQHLSGERLLLNVMASCPELPVIIMSVFDEVETVVRCIKAGACEYLVKPVNPSRLISVVRRSIELRYLRREIDILRNGQHSGILKCPKAFSHIVTNNASMFAIFRYCESIAKSQWPVLITGETGVGKELIARAIHTLSGRSGAFVAVNLAGLDDAMFSDTLFGHVRGAYTGAHELRKGLVETAAAGTLFLDEIGELEHRSQVKLLRVLQEHEFYPLGSDNAKKTNARLIFATNTDLEALQASGHFRRDLYQRLKTHQVHIPPLRKRPDDIPVLVQHFLEEAAAALQKKKPSPPKELYALLATYAFPGNVRELESMVYDAVANHESHMMSMAVFEERIAQNHSVNTVALGCGNNGNPFSALEQLPTLAEAHGLLIEEVMQRTKGNQTLAARLLGISRPALNRRLNESR